MQRRRAMRIGAFYFPTDYGINLAELGRALEDRGFASLFVPEHTHIPVGRRTPFPGGGELPKRYAHKHEPIVTAKAIATLDQLSNGRFVFGIGGGWNVDEMENHGARYETRFKMMREYVLAMKALWTEE